MYEIDEQQLRQWWQIFKQGNKLVEIRLLGAATYSGYFKNIDTLINALKPYLDHNNEKYYGTLQAYFTLNDIDDDLYSREQHDKFVKTPKSTSSDGNVTCRRMVMIDLDACRVSGISSNDMEFEKAHLKAVDVYRYLIEQGFNEPLVTTSGNGWHVYIPCDMPNDDEHNELVKRFLQSLGKMFTDEFVEIDEKVYNPARIDKLIGTWAKKGSDTKDRKWRMAKIAKVPNDLSPNDNSLFQKVADLLPKEEEPKKVLNRNYPNQLSTNVPFDLERWLNEHVIEYRKKIDGGSTKYEIKTCPWHETHSTDNPYSSVVYQGADGMITYTCAHSHCKDKQWADFRLFYEPDAYNKPPQQQYKPLYFQQRMYMPQQAPVLKKDEFDTTEDGVVKRWRRMKDIKKVNILDIPHFLTGFIEIDRCTKGLFEGDVTIVSGLNSSGKSSWLNSLILNVIEQGVRVSMWSGELQGFMLKSWVQMVAAGNTFLKPTQYGDYWYVPDDISHYIDEWLDDRLLLFDNDYPPEWSLLLNDMEVLVRRGVKLFVLDNLMSMSIDIVNGSDNQKQTALIKQICDFAKKEMCHIILVAHPRKATGFLRKTDISGTSDLTNAASNVLIVHRVNNDFKRLGSDFFGEAYISQYYGFGNVVEITKNRLIGAQDTLCGLHYEVESRRFKNRIDECIHYSWEKLITGDNGVLLTPPQQQELYPNIDPTPPPTDGLPFEAQNDGEAPF